MLYLGINEKHEMKPSEKILKKAVTQVNSVFTKEIMVFAFTPTNKNQFGISVINVRGGRQILIDYYFTTKTGKFVKSVTLEDEKRD